MGKALYRKYRSKKLSEIVGQEHVTTALENALKNDRVGHAYLFTGPRGVGKTSIARIMAHEVNQLPYDENATHLDIIEIDAASNRRIDEIRSLRERVYNAPTSAKYKVYIIDEVHMLTKEAFNALLKTLEEPPAHVIFILATTEVHKLPETIISRTQRYSFKPAERSATVKHLKSIAKAEKLDIDNEALELIAAHGRGSFRDSISLLDQIGNSGSKITADDVRRSLGIAPEETIYELINLLAQGSAPDIIRTLKNLHNQGYQAPQLAKQLGQALRQSMVNNQPSLDVAATTKLMQQLIDVPASHDPFSLLEITLLEPVLHRPQGTPTRAAQSDPPTTNNPTPEIATAPKSEKTETSSVKPTNRSKSKPKKADTKVDTSQPVTNAGHTILNEDNWQQVLGALKQKHNTLYGIARMAVPTFEEGKVTLCFNFAFHQKRMNDNKNRQIMSQLFLSELGTAVEIVCVVDKNTLPTKPLPKPETTAETSQDSPVNTISTIFGGAEILE